MRSSAHFLPLVCLPVVIERPGNYITRCGEVVTVGAVSSRNDFGCSGLYSDGVRERWHRSGRVFASCETANDVVRIA